MKCRMALLLVIALAACGGSSDKASTPARTADRRSTPTTLRSADEALGNEGRDADGHPIHVGKVGGDPVKLRGLLVAITSVGAPRDRDGDTVVDVTIRVENHSKDEDDSPEVEMTCGGEKQPSFQGSTYESAKPVPAGSFFYDGMEIMAKPADCQNPTIVAYFNASYDTDPVGHWPL